MSGAGSRAGNCARILVIGIGNSDRGDDGVGPIVVQSLAGRLPEGVEAMVRSGDMISLVEEWKPFDAVICVDAAASTGDPGRIHRFDLNVTEIPREVSVMSSHGFGLADAIDLARALGTAPKQLIVFAIEASGFDTGSKVSPKVLAAARRAEDEISAEIARLRTAAGARAIS